MTGKAIALSADCFGMEALKRYFLFAVLIVGAAIFSIPKGYASCFGSQSQLTCYDNLTGNIYNSRTYRPPAAVRPQVKRRFGWMPMQSQRKLGNTTIITGHTADQKQWKTYGKSYGNGDYRIIGSESGGAVQRTWINGKCF